MSRGVTTGVRRAAAGGGGDATRFATPSSASADRDRAIRRARRAVGSDRAAAAMPARRGGGSAQSRAARDAELDRRVAVRAAAMRGMGFHSSDSDDPTSASEGEAPRTVGSRTVAATRARGVNRGGEKGDEAGTTASVSKLSLGAGTGGDEDAFAALAAKKDAAAARRADRRERRARERRGSIQEGTETGTRTGTGTSASSPRASSPRASSPRASSRSVSVSDHPSSAGRSVLPARVAAKVTSTLRSLGDANRLAESIRVALSTGVLSPDGSNSDGSNSDERPIRVSAETIRVAREILPTAADLAAIRAAYGADRGADPSRASIADRFFIEMCRVPRAAAKADAVLFRASFPRKVVETRDALVAARDAANQAATSPRLAKLLDVVVALRDVLRRDATRDNSSASSGTTARGESRIRGESAWRIAAVAELTDSARVVGSSESPRGRCCTTWRGRWRRNRRLSCVSRRTRRHSRRRRRASPARLDADVDRLDAATRATTREWEACADSDANDADATFARSFSDSCATPRGTWRRCGRCRGRRGRRGETDGAVRAGAARRDVGGCASRVGGVRGGFRNGEGKRATRATRGTRENAEHAEAEGGGNEDEEA